MGNASSTQALQKYFASQQHQLQPKYEIRAARNVHIFDEKLGNVRNPSDIELIAFGRLLRRCSLRVVLGQDVISRRFVRSTRILPVRL